MGWPLTPTQGMAWCVFEMARSASATAIIGAGFGDEGKGFWTDAHAARAMSEGQDAWAIRFNGGAQAGHTVTTPEGARHVFHHIGSGALVGAGTYLSRHFALHPMLLPDELATLERLGVRWPRLMVDPRAPVTIPYDVMINQAIEAARGPGRHGSCGVGFGETMERCAHPEFVLRAFDLDDPERIRACLGACRSRYVPHRLTALGLPANTLDRWLHRPEVVERFVADATAMSRRVVQALPDVLRHRGALVFEGAQGLRLDQDLGEFPHVTRSHTGLPSLLSVAQEVGLTQIKVVYVTRAYVTRHGAGPLPSETSSSPAPHFSDPTNQPNPYQGQLRFAALDPDALCSFINRDLARGQPQPIQVDPVLAVNCLDQMGDATPLRDGSRVATRELGAWLDSRLGWSNHLEAWGAARNAACWR